MFQSLFLNEEAVFSELNLMLYRKSYTHYVER